MAVTLYHPKHDNGTRDEDQPALRHGRTFRPHPTADTMAKLKRGGWKDSPTEMPNFKAIPSAQDVPDYDLYLDESEEDLDLIEDVDVSPTGPPAVPRDIRAIPAAEAVVIINTISDRKVLARIQKRESDGPRPRRAVLTAIDARLEQVG